MSDFEDLLRRSLGERAGSVRTSPDEPDVARRIRRAERSAVRAHRAVLVASLVVAAGSVGGVLGALASRPAGLPLVQAADTPSAAGATTEPHRPAPARGTRPPSSVRTPAAVPSLPVLHVTSVGGVTIEWVVTSLPRPVAVVAGPGQAAACVSTRVVSLTVGAGGPVALAAGAVGMPALQPDGLAVISSGAFGSPGRAAGWWAVVEAGRAATEVAVQFPSGAVARAPVSAGGLAVVGALAPAGTATGGVAYGSAVADGAGRALGSMEFLFGGGIDAIGGVGSGDRPASACAVPPAAAGLPSGGGAGPPAPLVAAGNVVAAYAQAYDVDPLLGLTWNFAAVDLTSPLGCPVESLEAGSSTPSSGLAAPSVQVEAVSFTSATTAVVVYRRTVPSARGLLETGTASLAGGVWKVGGAAYCADMGSAAAG